jgi:glutaredoxin
MKFTRVAGSKPARPIRLYALSTCGWCRRVKELLNKQGVEYDYCDVDVLTGEDRRQAMAAVIKVNHLGSYPTIVIGDDVVVGYDENRIIKLLG